jgi:hypothetical protein
MVSFITKKHWTDYEGQFRDVSAENAPNKNLAFKITSSVTEEHWTDYGGRLREVPVEGGKNCP